MKILQIIVLVFILYGCDQNQWNGFKRSKSGLYYKYHKLGEFDYQPQTGDRVYAEIKVLNEEGELVYQNGLESGTQLQVGVGDVTNGGISEAISKVAQGDSVSFKFSKAINVKNLTNNKVQNWNKDFTLSVRVNRIQSHLESIKPLASAKDLELEELSKLKPFLDSLGIASEHHVQGVYLKLLKSGKGGIAQSGQQLFIHYRGFFINGIEYDNTRKSGQLLDFQLGKPNQVIKAFEIALHQMRAGDKMLVVSPSSLAFGDGGSATGIVPPYSSVIYELELIKIE